MSSTVSGYRRPSTDHFEPQVDDDPQTQRRIRGWLEQIDYAAFAANREVIGQALGRADMKRLQRLAVSASVARTRWVSEALALSERPGVPEPEAVERLTRLRNAYKELAAAYEAIRRMVERGYLQGPASE